MLRSFHCITTLVASTMMLALTGCSTVDRLLERDEKIPELAPLESSADVRTEWSRNVGSGDDGLYLKLRPSTANGLVYATGPNGDVAAVDVESGDLAWRTDTDARISGGVGLNDDYVFVGSLDGEVIALNVADGEPAWRVRVSSEVLAPPTADPSVVVVRTVDGKLYGLSARDGSRLWVYDRTVPALTLRGTSAPVIAGDLVVAGFDSGRLVALDIDQGRTYWESRITVPRGKSELERMVDIDAEPVVIGNVVYAVTFQGRLVAADLNSGEVLWRRDLSSFVGLSADFDHLYVTDDTSVIWALDRESGRAIWRQESLTKRRLTNTSVFGRYLAVGDVEGYLHILDRDTGVILARTQLDNDGFIAAPVDGGTQLIAHGRGGTLAAISVRE
ncbi:MAG: outer membrane protein assembly factor BamB [Pseudomonadota bacterium]